MGTDRTEWKVVVSSSEVEAERLAAEHLHWEKNCCEDDE